jgi:methyl-accepting chemotaxis protein
VQYKKLDVETKSHIRTVKEQAQTNTKIIEEAKQQLSKGKNISKHFTEIKASVKESQASSEELRKKYDVIIYKVKDCCSQAKAGYERNEHKADLAEKVR